MSIQLSEKEIREILEKELEKLGLTIKDLTTQLLNKLQKTMPQTISDYLKTVSGPKSDEEKWKHMQETGFTPDALMAKFRAQLLADPIIKERLENQNKNQNQDNPLTPNLNRTPSLKPKGP